MKKIISILKLSNNSSFVILVFDFEISKYGSFYISLFQILTPTQIYDNVPNWNFLEF